MALKVSIDTGIILDLILNQDDRSVQKLRQHRMDHDALQICDIVYGELCPTFLQNDLNIDLFLSEMDIAVVISDIAVYRHAGVKWHQYRQKRRFVCPKGGKAIDLKCSFCDTTIRFRQHILSDFVIGAFFELNCDGLLTRDYGYYRTYFPRLRRF
jgi:predicted nucleic acid-binding protein